MKLTNNISIIDLKVTYLYLLEKGCLSLEQINTGANFCELGIAREVLRRLEVLGRVRCVDGGFVAVADVGFLLWALSGKRNPPKEEDYSLLLSTIPYYVKDTYSLVIKYP